MLCFSVHIVHLKDSLLFTRCIEVWLDQTLSYSYFTHLNYLLLSCLFISPFLWSPFDSFISLTPFRSSQTLSPDSFRFLSSSPLISFSSPVLQLLVCGIRVDGGRLFLLYSQFAPFPSLRHKGGRWGGYFSSTPVLSLLSPLQHHLSFATSSLHQIPTLFLPFVKFLNSLVLMCTGEPDF